MEDKKVLTDETISRYKKIANSSLSSNKNKCLAAISCASDYLYEYNQYYCDDELEELVTKIANSVKKEKNIPSFMKESCAEYVLFYDGFGLDIRGVALMYLKALGKNGYKVVYVTKEASKGNIPTIIDLCNEHNFDVRYINMDNYYEWCSQLIDVFEEYKPRSAFFYTYPNDSSGATVFNIYEGVTERFLIDLTDHAFWLGKCAMDYCLGSREMSAYIQHYHRGIPKDKIIKLGVNLLVNNISEHDKLPFNPCNTRYIFSGGSLYKTLGDSENYYYRIVDNILSNHNDVKFVYAGTGDDREMRKIIEKFPDRAFLIPERPDYYYLIENCVFYLNTYPMFGGMMMKYSALAGRLPITLKHGSDSDGLLLHQRECNIEYDDYDELICDVNKLLCDDEYLKKREKLLEGSVVTEERFINNLRNTIENHTTDYQHEFIELDTTEFRKEYYERFNYNKQLNSIVKKPNLVLFWNFPLVFTKSIIMKIINKLLKRSK